MELQNLNQEQRRAVQSDEEQVLIMAGPGTGKTKTLTTRIAYLIRARNVLADKILGLTFTTKAAREMSERVELLLDGPERSHISTFHALGYQILRARHPDSELHFISEVDRLALIRELPRPQELRSVTTRELALMASQQKGALNPSSHSSIHAFVQSYNQALRTRGLIDFDDLLAQTYQLVTTDSDLRASLQRRYDHILIDEFQDTSELQWALICQLRGNANLFVIGDPKQAIYGFRGVGGEMFERFGADFPDHVAITLVVNYRSARSIVELAQAVFPETEALRTSVGEQGEVRAIQTLNEHSEADLVLQLIEQGIGGSDLLKASVDSRGQRFKDFAILYRTHQSARAVQQRLQESGIPYQVVGEGSPYEQPEVRTLIDALQWYADQQRLPKAKGLRELQVQTLLAGLDGSLAVSKLAQEIARALALEAGSEAKRLRLNQFVSTLVRFDAEEDGLQACLRYIHQLEQSDFYDPAADAVTLLTIHASKGLEFSHVILIAAEEGTLPHIRKKSETDFDEEHRLFYVAATRARDWLDIIYAKKRSGEDRQPSRFIAELDAQVLPRIVDPQLAQLEKKFHRRQQKSRQATLF